MNTPFPITLPEQNIHNVERFKWTVDAFNQANAQDPNTLLYKGESYPKEWFMAQALVFRTLEIEKKPSEALLLAAHSQHIKRWEIPRSSYPEGRKAYLEWRSRLKHFHAETSSEMMRKHGYDSELIDAVTLINLKEDIRSNPDCQTIEDALCLVFLEFQYEDIIKKYPASKVINILKKTAAKMSLRGLDYASQIPMSEQAKALLTQALA